MTTIIKDLAVTNVSSEDQYLFCAHINDKTLPISDYYGYIKMIKSDLNYYLRITNNPYYQEGKIGLNASIRTTIYVSLNQAINLTIVHDFKPNLAILKKCTFVLRCTNKANDFIVNMDEFIANINKTFILSEKNFILNNQTNYFVNHAGNKYLIIATEMNDKKTTWGVLSKDTIIEIIPSDDTKFSGLNTKQVSFKGNFNFKEMGIGGLDKQFATIARRAIISRIIPEKIAKELNIKPVRGILLFGPPGTGKTLIARKIGEVLNCEQTEPVKAGSLLDKFVGESERKIRDLFAPAIANPSKLYLIVFDEFDAICKKRGSRSGDSGVSDNVVNQLLSMIDGPTEINNVLLICTTNRKDLLDEAVLRPGRLEVHIEISLPDESGRFDILEIQTVQIKKSGCLDDNVNLKEIANITKNFTGAELAAIIKSATSIALSKLIDPQHMEDTSNLKKVILIHDDFLNAIKDINPMFGTSSDSIDIITKDPFILYNEDIKKEYYEIIDNIKNVKKGKLYNFLITGPERSGKTKMACSIAKESGIECIKFINSEDLITVNDKGISIYETFDKCFKTEESIVILDGLEYIIEYSPLGNIYNNKILQVIYAVLNKLIKPEKRLIIILTSSNKDLMTTLGIDRLTNRSFDFVSPYFEDLKDE
jgi:vesicle-fusing ATPase